MRIEPIRSMGRQIEGKFLHFSLRYTNYDCPQYQHFYSFYFYSNHNLETKIFRALTALQIYLSQLNREQGCECGRSRVNFE